ncbi:hypothetical protein LguiA_036412 [Lonicera macranthoides]
MPPKFDPSQVVDMYIRVTRGEVGTASSLTPKIDPLSLSPTIIETEKEGGFIQDEGLGVTTQEFDEGDGNDEFYVGSEEESDTNCLFFVSEDDDELIKIRKKKLEKNSKTKSGEVGGRYVGGSMRDANDRSVKVEGGNVQPTIKDDDYGSVLAASNEYYSPNSSDGEGVVKFKPKFSAFNAKVEKS